MENRQQVYVMIGTRAQFIKMAPVMREMLDQGLSYKLIYTAQHRENIKEILEIYNLPEPNIVLYNFGEANTKNSFFRWFISIIGKVLFHAKEYIPTPGILLTHGDTFTAWMAAIMGKRAGCKVGHIESGCRSFNLLSPFPEEISRLITFRFTDLFFCTDNWAIKNLSHYSGEKINMGANTMLDGVRFALNNPTNLQYSFTDSPYVIVSIHRYENIFSNRFVNDILPILKEISQIHRIIFTLHPATRERLRSLNLFDELSAFPNIILHERFGFIDWINLCNNADFVITDGGSNQEELSYLGIPTLLFRNETERQEGLNQNVVISKFDKKIIHNFCENLNQYRKKKSQTVEQPSKVVVNTLRKYF